MWKATEILLWLIGGIKSPSEKLVRKSSLPAYAENHPSAKPSLQAGEPQSGDLIPVVSCFHAHERYDTTNCAWAAREPWHVLAGPPTEMLETDDLVRTCAVNMEKFP